MKYTLNTLDAALDYLLPKIKKAKILGATFDRPTLLRMVDEDFFVESLQDINHSYEKRVAHMITAEALKDLGEAGCLVGGDLEFDFS